MIRTPSVSHRSGRASRGTNMRNEQLRPIPWPPLGEERYETAYARRNGRRYVSYAYRTPEGQLFTCIEPSLADCRDQRDKWRAAEDAARISRRALAEAEDAWRLVEAEG